MSRYDHGGGRLYLDDPARRTLVADFFNEGDREFLFALRNLAPQLLEVVEAAKEVQYQAAKAGPFDAEQSLEDAFAGLDKALAALGGKGE